VGTPQLGVWSATDTALVLCYGDKYFLTLLKSRGDKIDCGFFFTNTQNIIKLHVD